MNSTPLVFSCFQNLSSDPEQEYFSDGLTEETIAALGRVAPSRIRVIAWTSSMAYRGTRKTAGQIGGELAASYLVESTVRKEKEHLRITAKLVRVKDQVQVWNNTYDLELSGLLGVQQEIGTAIARQVGAEFSQQAKPPVRNSTQDADAQDLYLRGRYYLSHGLELGGRGAFIPTRHRTEPELRHRASVLRALLIERAPA